MTAKPKKQPHPLLAGRAKGVWWEDAVGVVPGYPRTLATFNRRRRSLSVSAEAQENLRDTTKPMRERLGFARAILEGFRDGLKS